MAILGDQFVAAQHFSQGEGYAGKALCAGPVIEVQGHLDQVDLVTNNPFAESDNLGGPQGLAVIPLGRVQVARESLRFREGVKAGGDVLALAAQRPPKRYGFATSRD